MKKLSLFFVVTCALSFSGSVFGMESLVPKVIKKLESKEYPNACVKVYDDGKFKFTDKDNNSRSERPIGDVTVLAISDDGLKAAMGIKYDRYGKILQLDKLNSSMGFVPEDGYIPSKIGFTSSGEVTFEALPRNPFMLDKLVGKFPQRSRDNVRFVPNWPRVFGVFGTGAALVAAVAAGVWKYTSAKKKIEAEEADVE